MKELNTWEELRPENGEDGSSLIVSANTGIIYSNQTGGVACHHPECEGFLVALGEYAQNFDDCTLGCWGGRDDKRKELATLIDSFFEEDRHPFAFRIDWGRISELEEAWWPVTFRIPGVESNTGYLCKSNCD